MEQERQRLTGDEVYARLASGEPLRGIEVAEATLTGVDASQLLIQDCRFVDVVIAQTDWTGLRCTSTAFVRCRFTQVVLAGATFRHCGFFDAASEQGCAFLESSLRFATFRDCTLDSAIFDGVDAYGITLRDSRAIGARFARAAFAGSATLTGNILRYADLRNADLAGCVVAKNDLEWAVLDKANLRGSNLRDSTLNQASVQGANFQGADLRNANLGGLDPRTCELRDAIIFENQMRQLLEPLGLMILPGDA